MIPKSIISTKVLLDAYTELRDRLNGQCGSDCPLRISRIRTQSKKQIFIYAC